MKIQLRPRGFNDDSNDLPSSISPISSLLLLLLLLFGLASILKFSLPEVTFMNVCLSSSSSSSSTTFSLNKIIIFDNRDHHL
ncbi:hypothetical protein DERP_005118 [Dermatophagoides pteronyssinus]|uniref:Transmembrane protein n=1 Tax=Dermatophagoides pteronyssinus TaxID=6956 RepID=A0ABQ8JTG1_DERPT|nr:hypothetical protein DERP_005118 [Dermatophagoides pteronyssinus]